METLPNPGLGEGSGLEAELISFLRFPFPVSRFPFPDPVPLRA